MKPGLALWLPLLLMAVSASVRLQYVVDQSSASNRTLKVSLQLPPAGPRPSRPISAVPMRWPETLFTSSIRPIQ